MSATIRRGACVPIVAARGIGGKNATQVAAAIVGAGVSVIACKPIAWSAGARFAGIAKGTGIPIAAVGEVRGGNTTGCRITGIIGTSIVIITGHRGANTDAILAMVGLGAGRSIETLRPRKRRMNTTGSTVTAVFRARIVVVTRNVVDDTVAIIVDAVTDFRRRRSCVTGRKPLFSAGADPRRSKVQSTGRERTIERDRTPPRAHIRH